MKGIKAIGAAALITAAIGSSSAFAQSTYDRDQPQPRGATVYPRNDDNRFVMRRDRDQQVRNAASRGAQYNSQTPEGNSANWGVGG